MAGAGEAGAGIAVELREGAALRADEWAAIIALCTAAFAEDFADAFATLGPARHILVRHDGALVAHACWVERGLQPDGLPILRAAYVEAVATDPAWQRRGLGSLAMTRLAEALGGYDLAALSPAAEEFYARLGWEMWRGPTAIRTAAGMLPTPEEAIMILRLPGTPPLDLDAPISAEWRAGELW